MRHPITCPRPFACASVAFAGVMASLACSPSSRLLAQEPARVLVETLREEQIPVALRVELQDRVAATIETSELRRTPPANALRRFLIDLGSGPVLTASLARTDAPGSQFGWSGRLEGVAASSVVLVSAANQKVFGTIQVGDTIFYLEQIAGKIHSIHRELQSSPSELPPDPPPGGADAEMDAAMDLPPLRECPPVTVDVLVVYTPRAKAASVGRELGWTMAERVRVAQEETNLALRNSGVPHKVRLLGPIEVQYTESGDLRTDRDRLSNSTDAYLPTVHDLRRQYGADVVSLWVGGYQGVCGIAYIVTQPQMNSNGGFHVVAVECATRERSFPHELGHNFGLVHDRDNTDRPGAEEWSYGYRDPLVSFRDIMARSEGCAICNRYLNFSNPGVFFKGRATGIDPRRDRERSAFTASTLRKTMCNVAQWHP
ncbi:MAG TPA: zinc-dependent metalloprotease family protein [Longimicrobiaceae bacterium]|nr:zinc-dependent metalloprotease family protein [Longimicrobiaceae bacterium]